MKKNRGSGNIHDLENMKRPEKPPKRDFTPLDDCIDIRGAEVLSFGRYQAGVWKLRFRIPDDRKQVPAISFPAGAVSGKEGGREDPGGAREAEDFIPELKGDLVDGGLFTVGNWDCHPEAVRFSFQTRDKSLRIYGLGEKMGLLERSGRVWEMWNTDEPDQTPSRDPLYVSIPFALCKTGERWFGILVDNPVRQYWDTRRAGQGLFSVEIEDRQAEIYLIGGDGPQEVVRRYTRLTGLPPLPPVWGLGYHQSRYSYQTQQEVLNLAAQFRAGDLPGDVIHLDIDYMDGYRVFTWDPESFPDPEALSRELHTLGFRLVCIVDPGVKKDRKYTVYREGLEKGRFCLRPDGTVYNGAVWPGAACFPDFSSRDVRSWWAEKHAALFEAGVAGIWNDMNEPSDFTGDPVYRPDFTVPDELLVRNDGKAIEFGRFHNLYGNAMNAATQDAFRLLKPDTRSFVISRAGYAGVQRYAGVWTGDNASWWEHLGAAIPMLLNLSISGVSLVGADVGGFQEDAPAQLYVRWFTFGAFTPYFRNHTEKETVSHEPWSFGRQTLRIVRHYLNLRYALLPYLYTAFYFASITGEPVLKPLFFEWPEDQRLETMDDQYLFGDHFMVAPVIRPNKINREVYFPEGRWYDFWDDTMIEGPADLLYPAPITRLPLWIRGGSIVPHEEPRMHTEEARGDTLFIDIYPDSTGTAEGRLYMDAEEGFSYQKGEYSLVRLTYSLDVLHIEMKHEGYSPPWENLQVGLHTGSRKPAEQSMPAEADPLKLDPARISLPSPFFEGGRGVRYYTVPCNAGPVRLQS